MQRDKEFAYAIHRPVLTCPPFVSYLPKLFILSGDKGEATHSCSLNFAALNFA